MSRLSTKQRRAARYRRMKYKTSVTGSMHAEFKKVYQPWLCEVLTTKSDLLDLIQRSRENMIASAERAMGAMFYANTPSPGNTRDR